MATATVKFAGLDEDPEFRSKFTNLIKLQLLLSQANNLLKDLFKERWLSLEGSSWDQDPPGSAQMFISGIGRKLYQGIGRIQKELLQSGNVDKWDITTLTDILIHVNFQRTTTDKQEKRYLELLKQVRNVVAHSPQAGISDPDLEPLWSKAEQVLVHFGWNVEEIQKLKNSTNVAEFENQNTSTVNAESSKIAAKLKDEGNVLFRDKEHEKAIEVYTKAIDIDGLSQVDRGVLYSNRSTAYLGLSEHQRGPEADESCRCALDDAKEAMRLRPAWYKGYFRAGKAYHALRKYEKAQRTYDWALNLAPGREEIQDARYESRRKLGIDTRNEHMDPLQLRQTPEDAKRLLEEKLGCPITDKQFQQFQKLSEQRIPGQADVYTGHDYRDGTSGMRADDETAIKFYSKAAALGNAEGIYNLGIMYKTGRGVPQDFRLAIKFLKEAASKPPFHDDLKQEPAAGVAEAMHALGLAHDEGVGVPQDYKEAFKWYKKASDLGCSNSSNNLAFVYRDGKGVPENQRKAGQYWHLAAAQGNSLAMESLGTYYLTADPDPGQAKYWHEQAIAKGNMHAKLQEADFNKAVEALEIKRAEIKKGIEKWEAEQGREADGLKLDARSRRMREESCPEATRALDELKRIYERGEAEGKTPRGTPKAYDPDVLSRYAAKGSSTAKNLLQALHHYSAAKKILMQGPDWDVPEFCRELAACSRLNYQVIQLATEMRTLLSEQILAYMKTFPDEANAPPPPYDADADKDARVCHMILNMFDVDASLRRAEAHKKKYPEEILFHLLTADFHAFRKDYKTSIKVAQESLKLFPGDADLLYHIAAAMNLLHDGKSTVTATNAVKAYQDFLDVAPKDHRKVPQSYYGIANVYKLEEMAESNSNSPEQQSGRGKKKNTKQEAGAASVPTPTLDKAKKYYKLGLEAEKVQLPCYLPYDSSQKQLLENTFRIFGLFEDGDTKGKATKKKVPPILPPTASAAATSQYEQEVTVDITALTSPLRIKVIREHREFVQKFLKEFKTLDSKKHAAIQATAPPKHKQGAPTRLAGLNPLVFKDMDMLKDKVYENCVLAVRSVEDPADVPMPSVRLVLEDENQDACRAFIYNFDASDFGQKLVQLGCGAKLSIINPYMRLAADGGYGIRVDDPSTLFLHSGRIPTACRFCGKENAALKCGRCKVAFYCSQECQATDWKKFQHKLICIMAA